MVSKLDSLRTMTTVVADTGDVEAVRRLKPVDCTTNPSIVLKALGTPEFAETVSEAITWGARQEGSAESRVAAVADRLAVSVGAALAALVPGRVSTEVDADLSFDAAASVTRAERLSRTMRTARSAASGSSSSSPPPGKASAPRSNCSGRGSTAT